jgi:hypothetical protein
MNPNSSVRSPVAERGYLLTEALIYIGLLFVVLGVGYIALYRSIDNSVVLRRNADDIASALHAGERWRADVRSASRAIRLQNASEEQVLHLEGGRNQVDYRFASGTLYRRLNSGTWVHLLENVRSCAMQADPRRNVTAWRWELELQPRTKASVRASRVRPLFTFVAVPPNSSKP